MRFENWISTIPLRLRSLFRRRAVEQELDEELQFHLDQQIALHSEKGLTPDEARYAALRALGNATEAKEQARDTWAWRHCGMFSQDVRYAARRLWRSPGFTTTALITLALGIGTGTAVFTIVDSVILEPLNYRESGQLVSVQERIAFLSPEPMGPNPRHIDVWSKRVQCFEGLALLQYGSVGLTVGSGHPELVGTVTSTANLFDVLAVKPLLGRTFAAEDGTPGHQNKIVLSHRFWQHVFNGDRNVIGKTVRLADTPRKIVGVLGPDFHFPNRNALKTFPTKQALTNVPEPSVFAPMAADFTGFSWNGEYGNWVVLGRLRRGYDAAAAQAELNATKAEILDRMQLSPKDNRSNVLQAVVRPLQEAVVGESRRGLWLLMGAVVALLLIACLNLANMQLARTLQQRREASVRSVLGAPLWRLVWNALLENVLLACVAAVAGVIIAAAGVEAFRIYSPVDLPRLAEVRLNRTVLLFAVALTFGSAILSSLFPAVYVMRFHGQITSRSFGGRHGLRLQACLIGLQVFGCTALLFTTGLFSKNLMGLLQQEKGFGTEGIAFAQVNLSAPTYAAPAPRAALINGVLESLRSMPGVEASGFVSALPLEGESWIESIQPVDAPQTRTPLMNLRWTSRGYLEAMRHKLVAGRFFEERDKNLDGIIVCEGLAKTLWPGGEAGGRKVRVQGRVFTVIGVVGDSRVASLKAQPVNLAYVHYGYRVPGVLFFIARGAGPADALAGRMREAIWNHAPGVTIARAKSLDSKVKESLASIAACREACPETHHADSVSRHGSCSKAVRSSGEVRSDALVRALNDAGERRSTSDARNAFAQSSVVQRSAGDLLLQFFRKQLPNLRLNVKHELQLKHAAGGFDVYSYVGSRLRIGSCGGELRRKRGPLTRLQLGLIQSDL
jgi:predicted permease